MAETKNYISKYSGDQLDAAIAVLGSLKTMFLSPSDFAAFSHEFKIEMADLKADVDTMINNAKATLEAANAAKAQAESAMAAANDAAKKVTDIAAKSIVNYEEI